MLDSLKPLAQTLTLAISFTALGTGCDFGAVGDLVDDLLRRDDPSVLIEPQPDPDPYLTCEVELDACLNDVYGPERNEIDVDLYIDDSACWEAFDDCLGNGEPPVMPPPPADPCEVELDECLNDLYGWDEPMPGTADIAYPDEEVCWQAYDVCLGYDPVEPYDPCDALHDDCIALGVDVALCEQVYDQCEAPFDEPCDLPDGEDTGYPADDGDQDDAPDASPPAP